ncbi:hypothetical protein [Neglectibacter timonensis]|jgi:hypothetical protein|uniref:Uncharacterized protein n=1 Tax=Neglectibacter timonensis TaxID=1776382 RepID=A0ABT1S425_9FIRM|nr:hypothetical protein [Neglectibacter timonensis]MCQ4841697.1 hypothetical protein [Neglectibacter timonensis]MCQ4845388.1 hypothetical protein [Neglectibacter timonensis]
MVFEISFSHGAGGAPGSGQGREKGKRKNRKAEHLISFEKETFAFPEIYFVFLL